MLTQDQNELDRFRSIACKICKYIISVKTAACWQNLTVYPATEGAIHELMC